MCVCIYIYTYIHIYMNSAVKVLLLYNTIKMFIVRRGHGEETTHLMWF